MGTLLHPKEPWHLRYNTGDRIPAAVLAYEESFEEDDMSFTDDDRARAIRIEETVARLEVKANDLLHRVGQIQIATADDE